MIKDLRYALYAGFMLIVCRKLGMASDGAALFIGMFLACYGEDAWYLIKEFRSHRRIRKLKKESVKKEES